MASKKYHNNLIINMPSDVKYIINTLISHGYEAYSVGGCVRDSILGKTPKDWDITTSATPTEIKSLFSRTIDTGIKHGTVTVMIKNTGYEVTTYRIDGTYRDGRHPAQVTFTDSLREDLRRRDFTINAMAYNDITGIVDCFGGMIDLKLKVIRCVGNPLERFSEDALRMLRAVRFSASLDFSLETSTMEAIISLAPSISKVSRERIQAELEKLLMSHLPQRAALLYDTGLMQMIFKENSFFSHTLSSEASLLSAALMRSPREHYIRWAVFASYVSANNIFKSLKFDNATVKICGNLIKHKSLPLPLKEPELKRCIVRIGRDIFGKYYLPYRKVLEYENLKHLEAISSMYNDIVQRGDCLSIKELKINGSDLAAIGIEPGRKMGDILNYLFDSVLDDHTKNNRETLIELAKNYT